MANVFGLHCVAVEFPARVVEGRQHMTQVGIVGGISVDHIVLANRGVRFDQPGGPGLYASLAAACVDGMQAYLITELPAEDVLPLRQILRDVPVNTAYCRQVDRIDRLWILDAPQGRRVVPVQVAAGESEFTARDMGELSSSLWRIPEIRETFDAILLSAPPSGFDQDGLYGSGVRGIDPDQLAIQTHGWRYIEECCRWATVLLPSRVQLCQLGDDPLVVADHLRHRFNVDVVAKLDKDGAVVMPAQGGIWHISDPGVHVVDTTGAGDVLAGATVAALARGDGYPKAVAVGVSAARLALSDWGVHGLLGAEIEALREPFSEVQISTTIPF